MKIDDMAFFYHSSCKVPGIAGVVRIAREAYPDATQFDPDAPYFDPKSQESDPRWSAVDVEFVEKFPLVVTLKAMRADPALQDMVLLRNSRLSVQPVDEAHWSHIISTYVAGKVPCND